MVDKLWQNSWCGGGWLHRFSIIGTHPQGVQELCLICKKVVWFPMSNGKIDHNNYVSYHIRDILTPNHPQFYKEYE